MKQQKEPSEISKTLQTPESKAVSIIRAIERNKVTRKTIEFYIENFPEEVTVAPTDKNGYPLNPREENLDLVTYMKDGKVKGITSTNTSLKLSKKNTVGEMNQLIKEFDSLTLDCSVPSSSPSTSASSRSTFFVT